MSDKVKTKKQLIAELDALRRRVSELEQAAEQGHAQAPDAATETPAEPPIPPDGDFDLSRFADAVSGTLRRMVPASCQLLLTAEERLGLVTDGPRPGEQIVVNLFHARV